MILDSTIILAKMLCVLIFLFVNFCFYRYMFTMLQLQSLERCATCAIGQLHWFTTKGQSTTFRIPKLELFRAVSSCKEYY